MHNYGLILTFTDPETGEETHLAEWQVAVAHVASDPTTGLLTCDYSVVGRVVSAEEAQRILDAAEADHA